jgi:hypothetical protein
MPTCLLSSANAVQMDPKFLRNQRFAKKHNKVVVKGAVKGQAKPAAGKPAAAKPAAAAPVAAKK